MLVEIFRDSTEVALGRDRVVVYLYRCGRKDPRAVQDDGRRLPGPRETRQGREEKFPINSGNWYKLCSHTIQSPFLFYWPVWHMLVTQGYFAFRSTITKPQNRLPPIPFTSSTEENCLYKRKMESIFVSRSKEQIHTACTGCLSTSLCIQPMSTSYSCHFFRVWCFEFSVRTPTICTLKTECEP